MTADELDRLERIGQADPEGYPYVEELAAALREVTAERDALQAQIPQVEYHRRQAIAQRDALRERVAELEHLLGDACKSLQMREEEQCPPPC